MALVLSLFLFLSRCLLSDVFLFFGHRLQSIFFASLPSLLFPLFICDYNSVQCSLSTLHSPSSSSTKISMNAKNPHWLHCVQIMPSAVTFPDILCVNASLGLPVMQLNRAQVRFTNIAYIHDHLEINQLLSLVDSFQSM